VAGRDCYGVCDEDGGCAVAAHVVSGASASWSGGDEVRERDLGVGFCSIAGLGFEAGGLEVGGEGVAVGWYVA